MPKLLHPKLNMPPRCPFCHKEIERPQPIDADNFYYEFDGGRCACGAVFSCDPTARNGGAVLVEAMVLACDGDWDKANSLTPEEDYDEVRITQYNTRTHRLGDPSGFGSLFFVRLKKPEADSAPAPS